MLHCSETSSLEKLLENCVFEIFISVVYEMLRTAQKVTNKESGKDGDYP